MKRIWKPKPRADRVPNLGAFFKRSGESIKVTGNHEDYHPGDLVTWMLPGNLPILE